MPNIAAAFMDDVNVRGPPTRYKNQQHRMVYIRCFANPTTVCSILCALASDQPRFGSDSKHISSDDQHYEVIPRTLGSISCWEHLNDINHVLQHVKKAGEPFQVENGCLHPRIVAVGHCCTYEDVTQRIEGPEDLGWLTAISHGFAVSWSMWCHTDLGQGFRKQQGPDDLTKKEMDFVWAQTEGSMRT